MDTIMSVKRGEAPDTDSPEAMAARQKEAERKARHERSKRIAAERKATELRSRCRSAPTSPPTSMCPSRRSGGRRIVKGMAVAEYTGLLDERALFLGQWGLRGVRGGAGPSYEELVETEGRPRLRYWLDRLSTDGMLAHAAVVYGYFPAVADGDTVHVLTEPDPMPRCGSVSRSRASSGPVSCASPTSSGPRDATKRGQVDVMPFQLVTMGQPIADFANELFAEDAYRDYLEVHGIGVQLTEALAEYWHSGCAGAQVPATARWTARTRQTKDYFNLEYRGARFSFGYGACPDLEDRAKMMASCSSRNGSA